MASAAFIMCLNYSYLESIAKNFLKTADLPISGDTKKVDSGSFGSIMGSFNMAVEEG